MQIEPKANMTKNAVEIYALCVTRPQVSCFSKYENMSQFDSQFVEKLMIL